MNRRLYPAILVVLGCAVYASSLPAPFQYDDIGMIVNEPSIRSLWDTGHQQNRPVALFSLSLNYALSGLDPAAFRITNIAFHIAAALLLYGIVRRTLRMPAFERDAASADAIGCAVAALWVVHPLNTMSVTYIWQRCESLMGMFFLATIYCVVRAAEGERRRLWTVLTLVSCALGLGTKEVMVAVIPVLLIFDGVLLAPSFRAALRERRVVYGFFALVTVAGIAVLLPRTSTSLGGSTVWEYARSQPAIVLEYAWMSIWPHPLSFDWARQPADTLLGIVPAALLVVGLLVLSAWLVWRRDWRGVAGAWFFLCLAPTSSFVAINDLKVEYRMYVPLVALVALAVAGGRVVCRRFGVPMLAPLALAVVVLGTLTVRRNQDYRTQISIWTSVLEVVPDNWRAHCFLVPSLLDAGRFDEALEYARRAIELEPNRLSYWNLGVVLSRMGDDQSALEQYRHALAHGPNNAPTHRQIAATLFRLGRYDEALAAVDRALALAPRNVDALALRARTLGALGRKRDAVEASRVALRSDPKLVDVWSMFGELLSELGQHDEADAALARALALRPGDATILQQLGRVHTAMGRYDSAMGWFDRALRADPSLARFLSELSVQVLSRRGPEGEIAMAVRLCEACAEVSRRRDGEVLVNLARVYAAVARVQRAREVYDQVLRMPAVAGDPKRRAAIERERAKVR